jgi:DNA polymerase-3 subunit gamma/tau
MRDAESMLDQLVSFCGEEIDEEDVLKIFGFTAKETVSALCDHLIAANASAALGLIHQQAEAGKDLSRLMADLITHLRNLLVAKADPEGIEQELGRGAAAPLAAQGERLDMARLLELIEQFAQAETRMKWAPNKKMHFEIAAIRAIQSLSQASLNEVLDTLAALRDGKPIEPAAKSFKTRGATQPVQSVPSFDQSASPRASSASLPPDPVPQVPVAPPSRDAADSDSALPAAVLAPKTNEEPEQGSPMPVSSAPMGAATLWPALLAEVRRMRPLIAMWVEAGTLLEIDGNTATVGFPPEQSLSAEYCQQPNNRKFLDELATRLAGRPLSLKFVQREGLVGPTRSSENGKSDAAKDPMEEFRNDPLIRKALEMFKAEIA